MTIDETKITTYHTICAIVLRELRVQRNLHQAEIADFFAKPPSHWQEVEAGTKKLDFDTLLRVCRGLGVPPAQVLSVADGYDLLLRLFGWSVVVTELSKADELIKRAKSYWQSPGYRAAQNFPYLSLSVLNVPYNDIENRTGWNNIIPVFQFAVDDMFRAQQLDASQFTIPEVQPSAPFQASV